MATRNIGIKRNDKGQVTTVTKITNFVRWHYMVEIFPQENFMMEIRFDEVLTLETPLRNFFAVALNLPLRNQTFMTIITSGLFSQRGYLRRLQIKLSQTKWKQMLDFSQCEVKTSVPREKSRRKGRHSTHKYSIESGINPGPRWWKASSFIIATALLPKSEFHTLMP